MVEFCLSTCQAYCPCDKCRIFDFIYFLIYRLRYFADDITLNRKIGNCYIPGKWNQCQTVMRISLVASLCIELSGCIITFRNVVAICSSNIQCNRMLTTVQCSFELMCTLTFLYIILTDANNTCIGKIYIFGQIYCLFLVSIHLALKLQCFRLSSIGLGKLECQRICRKLICTTDIRLSSILYRTVYRNSMSFFIKGKDSIFAFRQISPKSNHSTPVSDIRTASIRTGIAGKTPSASLCIQTIAITKSIDQTIFIESHNLSYMVIGNCNLLIL